MQGDAFLIMKERPLQMKEGVPFVSQIILLA